MSLLLTIPVSLEDEGIGLFMRQGRNPELFLFTMNLGSIEVYLHRRGH